LLPNPLHLFTFNLLSLCSNFTFICSPLVFYLPLKCKRYKGDSLLFQIENSLRDIIRGYRRGVFSMSYRQRHKRYQSHLTDRKFMLHLYIDFVLHLYIDFMLHLYIDFMLHLYIHFMLHLYIDFMLHLYIDFMLHLYMDFMLNLCIHFMLHLYIDFMLHL
jgi:hypothetical protein